MSSFERILLEKEKYLFLIFKRQPFLMIPLL